MLKYEFAAFFKSKRSIFFSLLIIGIIIADIHLVYSISFLREYQLHPVYDKALVLKWSCTPASAAFLSATAHGKPLQKIITWMLPLLLLLLHCDKHVKEEKYHYYQLLRARCSDKKIFVNKMLFAAIVGFVVPCIGLLINFGPCQWIFREGLYQHESAKGMIWFLSAAHPNIAYMCYIFIFCGCSALYSASIIALSYIFKHAFMLYIVSFGLWYMQIMSSKSLVLIIQPFIEFGPSYLIPVAIRFVCIAVGCIIAGSLWVRFHEEL